MDSDRTRTLARELRRGLFTIKQALETFARDEPNARTAALVRWLCALLVVTTYALSEVSGDGQRVPGDSRTLPQPRNRQPIKTSAGDSPF